VGLFLVAGKVRACRSAALPVALSVWPRMRAQAAGTTASGEAQPELRRRRYTARGSARLGICCRCGALLGRPRGLPAAVSVCAAELRFSFYMAFAPSWIRRARTGGRQRLATLLARVVGE
jgi:hypothetical protein